jgi:hypothetical protein
MTVGTNCDRSVHMRGERTVKGVPLGEGTEL